MSKTVVTRFAPSPTGYLHIGGARTALFNWLYARHTGGKYLLRIEDTDRERSTQAATDALLDSLRWLGLEWDGEPLSQFARAERHRQVARQLLATGNAYRCYLTTAELEAMHQAIEAERKLAKEEKRAPRGPQTIQSPWRDRDPKEAPAGVAPVLRLRVPRAGETVIDDVVQGRVVVPNTQLDDMIILRSDGSPIYNFAVVVDDHDMDITHVIRGVDHLTNAARQVQIYKALGWEVPVLAHIPLILGPDGKKLSKRHGALGARDLPRHGISAGGPAQLPRPPRLESRRRRDLLHRAADRVVRHRRHQQGAGAARLRQAQRRERPLHPPDGRARAAQPASGRSCLCPSGAEGGPELAAAFARVGWDRLEAALPSLKGRAKTLKELVDGARWLVAERPLGLDEKAAKALDAGARALLSKLLPRLETAPAWDAATLEGLVRAFSEAEGAKLGAIAQPLRAALTGSAVSPPVFDVMAALGREEALARIRDQAR